MKKTICAALVLAALVSCQKTPVVQISTKEKTKTISVTAPEGFIWKEDDRIVMNGLKSALTEFDIEDDTKCNFSFNIGIETPHCAVFPVSAFSSWDMASKTATVTLPATQNYDGTGTDALLMLGYSDKLGEVEISTALSYVKLIPQKGESEFNIKTVIVREPESRPLSGNFTALFEEEGCRLESSKLDGSTITVNCGGESGLGLGSPIVFAIPAGTYPKGIQFDIYDTDGSFESRTIPASGSYEALAGEIREDKFTFSPVSSLDMGEIPNAEVWNRFAARISAGDDFSGKTLKLMADINVANLDFADGVFNGKLDGAGRSITRSSLSRPLFRTLGPDAEVSSLSLFGTINSLDKAYEWGTAALAQQNLGTVKSVSVNCPATLEIKEAVLIGGIVAQNGGHLLDCSNDGDVTITYKGVVPNGTDIPKSAKVVLGGGIAAYGHSLTGVDTKTGLYYAEAGKCSAGVFENCNNSGTLSITAKSGVAGVSSFGGICGVVEYDGVQFKGCSNTGAISRISNGEESTPGSTSVGGILGRCAGTFANNWTDCGAQIVINVGIGYTVTIEDCTNSAALLSKCRHNGCVSGSATGARFDNVGGIVGAIVSQDATKSQILSCSNSGKISGGWTQGVNTTVLGSISGLAQNVDIKDCKAEGSLESQTGTCVGAAGGFAGFVLKNVDVTGTSSCSASFTMSKLNQELVMWWGLAFGYVKEGAASVSGVTFSSSVNIDDVVLNGENYTTYICNPGIEGQQPGSNVQPSVSDDCTWSE